jgi:hypothetical protein
MSENNHWKIHKFFFPMDCSHEFFPNPTDSQRLRKLLEALEAPVSGYGYASDAIEVIDLNLAFPLTDLTEELELPQLQPLQPLPDSVAYMCLGGCVAATTVEIQ